MVESIGRKTLIFWTLYDFATTPVAFAINAMYLPLMVIEFGGSNSIVGILPLVTGAIAGLWSPIMGTIIDRSSKKSLVRRITIIVSVLIAGISIVTMTAVDLLFQLLLLFTLMTIGIQTGWTAMNAYFAQEVNKSRMGTTSAFGIMMGYLGGAVGAGGAVLLDRMFGRGAALMYVGLFLILFGMISGGLIKERRHEASDRSITPGFKIGLRSGIHEIRDNSSVRAYLIGAVLWGDAVSTIITFASLLVTEVLQLSEETTLVILAIAVPSALIGAFIHGKIGDKIGLVKVQGLNICLWTFGIGFIMLFGSAISPFAVGMVAGIALGGNMSVSRALYARIIPEGFEARLFGFAAIFMYFGGAIGPLLTGIVADIPGWTLREALIIPLIFLVSSLMTLKYIRVK